MGIEDTLRHERLVTQLYKRLEDNPLYKWILREEVFHRKTNPMSVYGSCDVLACTQKDTLVYFEVKVRYNETSLSHAHTQFRHFRSSDFKGKKNYVYVSPTHVERVRL